MSQRLLVHVLVVVSYFGRYGFSVNDRSAAGVLSYEGGTIMGFPKPRTSSSDTFCVPHMVP